MWLLNHQYIDISKPKTSKLKNRKNSYSWQPGCQLVEVMTIALTVKDGKRSGYARP